MAPSSKLRIIRKIAHYPQFVNLTEAQQQVSDEHTLTARQAHTVEIHREAERAEVIEK